MDSGEILSEAVSYTREAFEGKWVRWLIFIILALPMALLPFTFDPAKIIAGSEIRWELIPWGQVAALIFAAIIFSFFTAGYMVRVYRGTKPAPDFDNWGHLFVDGIKLAIVTLLWFIPILIVILFIVVVAIIGGISGTGVTGILLGLVLLALLALLAACIFVVLFSPMGEIRFARTGSITEGLNFTAIRELIGRIGWGQYIIALIVLLVAIVIFTVISIILSMIPYIGWVLTLVITPLLTVFTARYYTLIYEQGNPQPLPA